MPPLTNYYSIIYMEVEVFKDYEIEKFPKAIQSLKCYFQIY